MAYENLQAPSVGRLHLKTQVQRLWKPARSRLLSRRSKNDRARWYLSAAIPVLAIGVHHLGRLDVVVQTTVLVIDDHEQHGVSHCRIIPNRIENHVDLRVRLLPGCGRDPDDWPREEIGGSSSSAAQGRCRPEGVLAAVRIKVIDLIEVLALVHEPFQGHSHGRIVGKKSGSRGCFQPATHSGSWTYPANCPPYRRGQRIWLRERKLDSGMSDPAPTRTRGRTHETAVPAKLAVATVRRKIF